MIDRSTGIEKRGEHFRVVEIDSEFGRVEIADGGIQSSAGGEEDSKDREGVRLNRLNERRQAGGEFLVRVGTVLTEQARFGLAFGYDGLLQKACLIRKQLVGIGSEFH